MKKSVNKANPLSNFENKLYTLLKNNYIEDIKKQVHHTKQKYMNIYLTFDMNYLYVPSLILINNISFLDLIKTLASETGSS